MHRGCRHPTRSKVAHKTLSEVGIRGSFWRKTHRMTGRAVGCRCICRKWANREIVCVPVDLQTGIAVGGGSVVPRVGVGHREGPDVCFVMAVGKWFLAFAFKRLRCVTLSV
jgi:hypothetical protein